jgi:type II secretory pathway predicted ATPase ExeA
LSDTGAENLIGRRDEQKALSRLVRSASEGRGALLILGPAGIGKTALLHDAVATATNTHLVTVTGVESEMELPYASLHLLSQSLLADDKDLISTLPTIQRVAFETALGLSPGPPPLAGAG